MRRLTQLMLHVLVLALLLGLTACSTSESTAPDASADGSNGEGAQDGGTQNGGTQDHVDKMAAEHADDTAAPSPAAFGTPAAPVVEDEVVYATLADGSEARGYLARPAEGADGAPGILVIHEWWGLNDNIRSMARQLAGEGYNALAVDLYGGQVAEDPEGARQLMMASAERREQLEENLGSAYAYLDQTLGAPRIGSIGWCFGGGWSLRTALMLPDQLDGAVVYYGRLVTEPEQLATLQMPVLGIFGEEDQGIPIESVRAFETALQETGREASIHVYPGAHHAFANPSGTRYDAAAATDAWAKTLSFFAQALRGAA